MRPARLEHLVLLDSADIDEAVDAARTRAPIEILELTVRMRATDGGRFDEAVSGRAGLALESMPEWARHEIARCQRYATVVGEGDDALARERLQAAEIVLRALAEAGELSWTLDVVTSAWRTRDEILARAADSPFCADDHFLVVVEAIERAPGKGHLVRTRGLGKFGRPDIAMHAPRSDAERVAAWVREVGRRGAMGEVFLPGRQLSIPPLPPVALWPRAEDGLGSAPAESAPIYLLKEGGLSLVR